MQISVIVS